MVLITLTHVKNNQSKILFLKTEKDDRKKTTWDEAPFPQISRFEAACCGARSACNLFNTRPGHATYHNKVLYTLRTQTTQRTQIVKAKKLIAKNVY